MQATTLFLYSLRAALQEVSVAYMSNSMHTDFSMNAVCSILASAAVQPGRQGGLQGGAIAGIVVAVIVIVVVVPTLIAVGIYLCSKSRRTRMYYNFNSYIAAACRYRTIPLYQNIVQNLIYGKA